MKNRHFFEFLIASFLLFIGFSLKAQCDICPSTVIKVDNNNIRLVYKHDPIETSKNVVLNFGSGNNNNGSYIATKQAARTYNLLLPNPVFSNEVTFEMQSDNTLCYVYNNWSLNCRDYVPNPSCDFTNCSNIISNLQNQYSQNNISQWNITSVFGQNVVYRTGKVSIGSENYSGLYSLTVDGGIQTKKFNLELCGTGSWCDHVFLPKYDLKPLEFIKNFVLEEGHLPNMINNTDVEKEGGIEMRKTIIQQQEKIEEAYLYLIELNQNLMKIRSKINKVKDENYNLLQKLKN